MGAITFELIQRAFELGKKKHNGSITSTESKNSLISFGMNEKSATIYTYAYGWFKEEKVYTQTINAIATEYYIREIYNEDGTEGLKIALNALWSHILYYESKSKCQAVTNRLIHEKFQTILKENIVVDYYNIQIENSDILLDEMEIQVDDSDIYINENEIYSDEFELPYDGIEYFEGGKIPVLVNKYERNRKARQKCIEHYGSKCQVCDLNFEEKYGDIGMGFIHVHHLKELSTIGKEYVVDPINDLRPVCPNCHSMLHKRTPSYPIEELKQMLL